jgi:hypothetical protein
MGSDTYRLINPVARLLIRLTDDSTRHPTKSFLFEIPHSFASDYVAALKSAGIRCCEECFAALCDPDQTLLLENQLEKCEPTQD